MPRISIVMPAYNAEDTILESIASIQNQTFLDWELIVVDAGSSDATCDIVGKFIASDERISLHHCNGCDIIHAREAGIACARGEYLMFCDADDWIEPAMLVDMIDKADAYSLDMCVTGFYREEFFPKTNKWVTEICTVANALYLSKDDFRNASADLFSEGLFQGVTGILYRMKRLSDLSLNFETCSWSEHDFILSYLLDIERVGVLTDLYYHFKIHREEQRTPQREIEILKLCKRDYDSLIALYESWGLLDNHSIYQKLHEIFFNELTDCIEGICNPSCVISIAHKQEILDRIVQDEATQKAVSIVSPKNRMQQMLIGPIKKKNTALLYSEARFISFIKHYNSSVVSQETTSEGGIYE